MSCSGEVAALIKLAGDELLWRDFCFTRPALRGTVSGESGDEMSDLEPFFGTGGADSSISVRASSDLDPEICEWNQKDNSRRELAIDLKEGP